MEKPTGLPRVDVAVPCYQYGHYLRACVTSILEQDYPHLRVLIIDNASTDDSLAVARSLAAQDSRVEVIAHPVNLGHHASYNEAVDWATAEYFLLIDADDLMAPGCLSRGVAFLEANPDVVMTYGRQAFVHGNGPMHVFGAEEDPNSWTVTEGDAFIRALCATPIIAIGAESVLRRTSAQKQAGHYRSSLPYTDDVELWLRIARLGKVARTGAIQAVRRIHDTHQGAEYQRLPSRDFEGRQAAFDSFFAHEGGSLPDAAELARLVRRRLGEQAYWSGLAQLARGNIRPAAHLARFALSRSPRSAVMPPVGWLPLLLTRSRSTSYRRSETQFWTTA
jgi:glycosyltransferase involved in cell wall biosynthesis